MFIFIIYIPNLVFVLFYLKPDNYLNKKFRPKSDRYQNVGKYDKFLENNLSLKKKINYGLQYFIL